MALSQNGRMGKLTTQLGPDVLCLVEMTASEGLSELFEFEIHAASEDRDIDLDQLIGKPCHVEIDAGEQGKRLYHGILAEGDWLRDQYELSHYRLLLRPWTWLLSKTTDCRIFHDKTVVDIVRETFKLHGLADYRLALTHDYPVLHYTVQYRESDLNFVTRLIEQHGIYFYFAHSADKHELVLCDAPASHTHDPKVRKVIFHPDRDASHKMRRPTVFSWSLKRSLRSGKVDLNAYNPTKPNAAMRANAQATERYGHADLEVYNHHGPFYPEQPRGETYAKVLLEAEQAQDKRRVAEGTAVAVYPGAHLRVARHKRKGETGEYLTVRVDARFGPQIYWSGRREDERAYDGSFEFQKLDLQYRAPLATQKPLIHSLQTALVVGADGEEIDCDDHGRILVHFYWDRHSDKSCRVRVNQVWGAKTWGMQTIPRIGMEVMVAFIEGDPDRPIIVGVVPDPENNTVPYQLPANKTRMVWRSNSHKSHGFNEFAMEDKTGGERMHFHAQKDMTSKVGNNATQRVDNSLAQSIGGHKSTEVSGNHNSEIGGSQTNIVGGTGLAVMAALAPLAGLMGQTAGLAGEASGLAGGIGAIEQLAMGVVGQGAQALLGALAGGAGGRPGVVAGPSPRADAGDALTNAGTQLLQGVASMFGLPGVQKNFISQAQITAVGQMAAETVGTTKAVNVGKTFFTRVGDKYQLNVGNEVEVIVGKSLLVMKKDGTILLKGVKIYVEADNHIQHTSAMIDHN